MCGIAGKIALASDGVVDRYAVLAMTAALSHRGAGRGAHYFDYGVGLGYHGLAATADRCAQPACSDNGATTLVGDFGLTNERELVAELRGLGQRVCRREPAEVVLHAYLEWGDAFVEHLRGAFACAVWDGARRRLLLVRDPLGLKPILYSTNHRTLSFASEVKALLQDEDVPRDCDPTALQEYLALGYVPAPATVVRTVSKLPAGHMAVVEHGAVKVRQYWELPAPGAAPSRDAADRLAALARDAVRAASQDSHDEATVMLSGGPSSCAVAAVLADTSSVPVTTVTAAIDESAFIALTGARELAKAIGARHYTELSAPRLAEFVPRLVWHLDEPCANPSALMTYLACSAVRDHASHVLAGHGGRYVLGTASSPAVGVLERARRAVAGPSEWDCAAEMSTWRRLRRTLDRGFVEETCFSDPLDGLRGWSAACESKDRRLRARYLQLKTGVPDQVLSWLDRASSALSLQVRLPLLDRYFVEAAASVASPPRFDEGLWLRRLSRAVLPATVPAPTPGAFGRRVATWLRGPLAPVISDVLLGGRFRQRGVFAHKTVTHMWQQHLTGRRDHHQALWSMLMLELWFEQFVDNARTATRAA